MQMNLSALPPPRGSCFSATNAKPSPPLPPLSLCHAITDFSFVRSCVPCKGEAAEILLWRANELQRAPRTPVHSAALLQGTRFLSSLPEVSVVHARYYGIRQRDKGSRPGGEQPVAQTAVYARATMRRPPRLRGEFAGRAREQEGRAHCGEGERGLRSDRARAARDILAGRHLCARRRVTACARASSRTRGSLCCPRACPLAPPAVPPASPERRAASGGRRSPPDRRRAAKTDETCFELRVTGY